MINLPRLLQTAHHISRHFRDMPRLVPLARRAGMSPSHLQRAFKHLTGESPTAYATRLRVTLVATELLRSDGSLLRIARRSGFASVEVLIRNFRRQFGCTPAQYRTRHRRRTGAAAARSLAGINALAPCLSLFRVPDPQRSPFMPLLSSSLRTLQPQPALIIRSRIARSEIAATIGESLGRIVPYAMGVSATLAGQPFARYPDFGPGSLTIEVGMPIAAPVAGKDDIEAFELPGGRFAVGLHGGPYTHLTESFTALERWITSQGLAVAGPAWELYVNDPADHPDPADWRTEIYLPVRP